MGIARFFDQLRASLFLKKRKGLSLAHFSSSKNISPGSEKIYVPSPVSSKEKTEESELDESQDPVILIAQSFLSHAQGLTEDCEILISPLLEALGDHPSKYEVYQIRVAVHNVAKDLTRLLTYMKAPSSFLEKTIDMQFLMQEIYHASHIRSSLKNIYLSVDFDACVPLFIKGDFLFLYQILVNLVYHCLLQERTSQIIIAVEVLKEDLTGQTLRFRIEEKKKRVEGEDQVQPSFIPGSEIAQKEESFFLEQAFALAEDQDIQIKTYMIFNEGWSFYFDIKKHEIEEKEKYSSFQSVFFLLSEDEDLRAQLHSIVPSILFYKNWEEIQAQILNYASLTSFIFILDRRQGEMEEASFAGRFKQSTEALMFSLIIVGEEGVENSLDSFLAPCFVTIEREFEGNLLKKAMSIADYFAQALYLVAPLKSEPLQTKTTLLVLESEPVSRHLLEALIDQTGYEAVFYDLMEFPFHNTELPSFSCLICSFQACESQHIASLLEKIAQNKILNRLPLLCLVSDLDLDVFLHLTKGQSVNVLVSPFAPKDFLSSLTHLLQKEKESQTGEILPSYLLETATPLDESSEEETEKPLLDSKSPLESSKDRKDILDRRILDDIARLGGSEFLVEIVRQFFTDASGVLLHLAQAMKDKDVEAFRDHAHALRSCAANVGAQAVYQLCLSWREIKFEQLVEQGSFHLAELQQTCEAAKEALNAYLKEKNIAPLFEFETQEE